MKVWLGIRTRTVLRTEARRGKSCTPAPRVATEDSSSESEVRSEVTQSAYVGAGVEVDIVVFFLWRRFRKRNGGSALLR